MKLHPNQTDHYNTVTAYGDGYVEINARRYQHSVIVMPEQVLEAWPVDRFEDLTPEHFGAVAAHQPELVLFGSGARLRFPHPRLVKPLQQAGIGVETMDMKAACRTYNILMTEGRKVAVALLVE